MRYSNGWEETEDPTVCRGLQKLGYGKMALEQMNRRLRAYMSVGESQFEPHRAVPRSSIGEIRGNSYFSRGIPRSTAQSDWEGKGLRRTASKTHDSIDGVEDRLNEIKQENNLFMRLNGTLDNQVEAAMRAAARRQSEGLGLGVPETNARSGHGSNPSVSDGFLPDEPSNNGASKRAKSSQDLFDVGIDARGPNSQRAYRDYLNNREQGVQVGPSVLSCGVQTKVIDHERLAEEKKKLLSKFEQEQEQHLREKEDLLSIIENQKVLIEHFRGLKPEVGPGNSTFNRINSGLPSFGYQGSGHPPQIRPATSSSRFSNDGEMAVNREATSISRHQQQFPGSLPVQMPSQMTHDQLSLNVPMLRAAEPSFRSTSQVQTAGSGHAKDGSLKVPSQTGIRNTTGPKAAKKKTRIEGDKVIAIGGPQDVERPSSTSKISFSQSRSRSRKQTPSPGPPLQPIGPLKREGPDKFERIKKLRNRLLPKKNRGSKDKAENAASGFRNSAKPAPNRARTVSKSPKPKSKDSKSPQKTTDRLKKVLMKRIPPKDGLLSTSKEPVLKQTSKKTAPNHLHAGDQIFRRFAHTVRPKPSNLFGNQTLPMTAVIPGQELDSFNKGMLAYCFARKQVMPEYKKKVDVFVDRLSDYLRARALRPSASEILGDPPGEATPSARTDLTNFVQAVAGVDMPKPRSRSTKSSSVSPIPMKLASQLARGRAVPGIRHTNKTNHNPRAETN